MKILTILGARPQFIKAAMVSRHITHKKNLTEIIVHTGQHFDPNMSDVFFREMNLPEPGYSLNVNQASHGEMTGKMLERIEPVLFKEIPDIVLVYGDTNSTLAGALTASKLHIPIAHVEAGLRSYNREMPEEINRVLTDHCSTLLFCPTENAEQNLKKEGIVTQGDVIVNHCGDVMYDAFLEMSKKSHTNLNREIELNRNEPFVLATIHRQENTDKMKNLRSIVKGLNQINKTTRIVMPLHPRTKKKITEFGFTLDFKCIPPVGYISMVRLLRNCEMVITDSGGLQKEAYFSKKYCITVRPETEWVELVQGGFNRLSSPHEDDLLSAFQARAEKKKEFSSGIYGEGNAGQSIVNSLINYLK